MRYAQTSVHKLEQNTKCLTENNGRIYSIYSCIETCTTTHNIPSADTMADKHRKRERERETCLQYGVLVSGQRSSLGHVQLPHQRLVEHLDITTLGPTHLILQGGQGSHACTHNTPPPTLHSTHFTPTPPREWGYSNPSPNGSNT